MAANSEPEKRVIPFYDEAPLDDLPARVFVYRNLAQERSTGERTYSVQDAITGRVVAHVKRISLRNVGFVVRPAGREKVRQEKAKNVHAGLRGVPTKDRAPGKLLSGTYNPYENDTFVNRKTEEPVLLAPYARMDHRGMWFVASRTSKKK